MSKAVILAALLVPVLTGCGPGPQPRPPDYVDQMVFAPETPDPSTPSSARRRRRDVAADALESPTRKQAPAKSDRAARCGEPRAGPTRSIGSATAGRLRNGCLLPRRGSGYVRKNPAGYGAEALVGTIQWATSAVARLYPGTVSIVIGALSKRGGGRLRGHRSHQSGRDIDIGLFATNNRRLPHFRAMHRGNLDIQKSWALLGAILSSGRVQYIFMDYELQVLFVRYLEDEGVPAATLARLFQFPAGRRARRGIIRHARGHGDHVHVRLHCEPEASDCR